MISKYCPFLRNIDSLGDRGKKQFFKVASKCHPFPRNIDSLGDRAKKQVLGKNQFFQGDLKMSSFSPKY